MVAPRSLKNLVSGLIFVGLGLAFGYASLGYQVGTALRMGPGYFPLLLSGLLVLLGVVILIQAIATEADEAKMERVPWSGLALIMGALVFFGATVRGLGLVPALFVATFMSAFASSRTGLFGALAIAAVLVLICVAIFIWGLGMPLRTFGPWLGF
jgi:hypothetical protein